MAILVKNKLGYDDSLDAFGIHGVGGIVGACSSDILYPSIMDGGSRSCCWRYMDSMESAWSTGSCCRNCNCLCSSNDLYIMYGLNKFMKFKSTEDDEMAGLDRSYHGERGYGMLNPS